MSFAGVTKRLPRLAFMLLLALVYRQLQAPPPKVPGTPGGPLVTSPRIRLQDGRHLAYYESGVPKDQAKYKVIYVHGFDSCKYDALAVSQVSDHIVGLNIIIFSLEGLSIDLLSTGKCSFEY